MSVNYLEKLEAEAIHIFREVAAGSKNPVMLYSVGKDSSVMLHIARKAFYPAPPPFPLLHIDTGWKFRDMIEFRNKIAQGSGTKLLVHVNQEAQAKNITPFSHDSATYTYLMKTQSLRQALDKYGFDFALGGGRRDEEKSRAKERIFSVRNHQHAWDPKNQRPEMWKTYNTRIGQAESIRAFPLSNWTELDVWSYIRKENIPVVPLYFAAIRPVVNRNGVLIMVDDDRMPLKNGERVEEKKIRFRSLGCYPLSAAMESTASTIEEIVLEMLNSRTSEREGRLIDVDEASSMERKKRQGYF